MIHTIHSIILLWIIVGSVVLAISKRGVGRTYKGWFSALVFPAAIMHAMILSAFNLATVELVISAKEKPEEPLDEHPNDHNGH